MGVVPSLLIIIFFEKFTHHFKQSPVPYIPKTLSSFLVTNRSMKPTQLFHFVCTYKSSHSSSYKSKPPDY